MLKSFRGGESHLQKEDAMGLVLQRGIPLRIKAYFSLKTLSGTTGRTLHDGLLDYPRKRMHVAD